jgi:acyl-CoA synthetase (AMP-forming)/AMP-acid ligase II
MDIVFIARTLVRRGLLAPGRIDRVIEQLNALRKWGFTLVGELRSATARNPGRIVAIDDDRSITYRDLLSRSQRLAAAMRGDHGVRSRDRVAVMCRNHIGMVEAMTACSIIGADAVLVNTALSAEQLHDLVDEQRVVLLIHDDEFAALAGHVGCARMDERDMAAAIERTPRPRHEDYSRDGRVIVLTSGTTGTPKGARRPTPGGIDPLCSIIDRIPLRVHERMALAAPMFHTWGYAGLQIALAVRGTVVIQRRFEPAAAVAAIDRHGCTSMIAVPVMLQRLLDADRVPSRPPRVVAVSGSALTADLAAEFMADWGACLYNLYGSTEVSWASIATPADLRRSPRTAGRPPHGTRLAVLDPSGRLVGPGVLGELHVGNDMLFEGYTAGARRDLRDGLLATGDIGRIDSDGLVFVEGRADDMVISGGENVFPGPVEDVIGAFSEVRDVAVVGVEDPAYGQRLAAYLVLRDGRTLDPDEVRSRVREHLARFSVPRDVHFVDELPRTATGKVIPRLLSAD